MSKQEEFQQQQPPNYDQAPQQQVNLGQQGYPAQQGIQAQQVYYQPQLVGQPQVAFTVINQPVQENVPDHFIFSILNTLFCCFCIGIAAIMKSVAVQNAKARGDLQGARAASQVALRLNKIALGVGIGVSVLWITGAILYNVFAINVVTSRYTYGYRYTYGRK